jgi:uncharacterized membrane protein
MLSVWSGVVSATADSPNTTHPNANSEEIIQYPSWQVATPTGSYFELRQSSGIIHSPYGPFDPLFDPIPLGPENLYDPKALERTEMVIVQSSSSDLTSMLSTLQELDLPVLDRFPDDSAIIRVDVSQSPTIISSLMEEKSIRWAGSLPIAWRVSPELSHFAGREGIVVDIDITPAPDLEPRELTALSVDLASISGDYSEREACDQYLCQPRLIDSYWIPILAMDGRILSADIASIYSIQNTNASLIGGIEDARVTTGLALNGSGEVLAVSDTGLDEDHGDFGNRIRAIYDQFGPDNSHSDANSGHGTHVSATLLGDGSGNSDAEGMVPAATFHFYQLEADSNGLLARWGSLYEMFSHSWQNNARIQTNSWGNENLVGEYSSDSRSADSFLVDYPRFLVLFSAGDLAGGGITPPGTSKNVITVGASTTGSFGSSSEGSVAPFSSRGTTADGRIKPDIVAPGVAICSARAEEAQLASGDSCSSATHSGTQTPLYMTLDGSSMATPVAAGAATMVRQYLRESQLITEPRSDLIKAILINGAEDIGEPDIPNSAEGWGQLDLDNSLSPHSSEQSLNLFYDYSRELLPGHSFVYTFDVDGNYGLDVTLVWNDQAGSAVADQSASRLVNDLDLRVVSPDGTVYLANNFISGFSSSGGSEDRLNNVERVRIPTGSTSGSWSVIVGHAGGSVQDYAIVLTGLASETQSPDLTVFPNSLSTSVANPLQGDTLLIEAVWKNQAAAPTGTYSIEIKDLTAGTVIHNSVRSSLAGGVVDSISFPHSFSTTGTHELELRLDSNSEVSELNDENSGIDNNWIRIFVNVSQIGVRLTPLMEDGSVPSNPAELNQAMARTLDPREASWVLFELEMRNEGTSEISVGLSVSPVQLIGDNGVLYQPQDEWWKLINESGPWTLAPFGEEGDRTVVTLNMSDMDTDLSSDSEVVYALPGTFVSDLTLFDTNSPTVSHSIRLSAVVERVEGLFTVVAGTESLGAEPGELAVFSLSIKNTGNGPTQYIVSCESTDRWTISIGNSQSSEITLEPLSRLQFLPLPIRVRVPHAVAGMPPAGFTQEVECTTTSVMDQNLQTIELATVTVLESFDFSPELFDSDDNALGPIAVANPRPVLNGDVIVTDLLISNDGNVPMVFTVNAFSSLNTWPIQMTEGSNVQSEELSVSISAGGSKTVSIATIVPLTAQMGDSNLITVRTTLDNGPTVTNSTRLLVQEIATLDLSWNPVMSVALGMPGTADIYAHNVGNIELDISLTMGSLPEGWSGGFLSGREFPMDMNQQATIQVGMDLPGALPIGLLDTQVSVIIEARTPGGETAVYTADMTIEVVPSIWLTLSCDKGSIEGIGNSGETVEITVANTGNTPSGAELIIVAPGNWEVAADQNSFSLGAGEYVTFSISITPNSGASNGLTSVSFYLNSTDDGILSVITNGSLELGISKARDSSRGGLGGVLDAVGLPDWTLALIFLALLSTAVVYGVRMRKSSSAMVSPEEELIPEGSALLSGSLSDRRAAALETSSSGEVLTGGVSDEEIQAALAQSSASAPPPPPDGAPPLPLSGLPEGWTMEQWASYGHLWWEQNNP